MDSVLHRLNEGGITTGTLLAAAVALAALHALLPSHWLSFVAVGRARRWSLKSTLWATLLAGIGHVLLTTLLGLLLAGAGRALWNNIHLPPMLEQAVLGTVLIILGLFFLVQGMRHKHTHLHVRVDGNRDARQDKATVLALALGLILSPCLDFLPLYVAASAQPLWVLLLIGGIFLLITPPVMTLLVGATQMGLRKLPLAKLENYEGVLAGAILLLVGVSQLLMK